MPWKTTTPMEEIIRFVSLAQTDDHRNRRAKILEFCVQAGA
jgi:hypothetical protein